MRRPGFVPALFIVIGTSLYATTAHAQHGSRSGFDPLFTASVSTGAGGWSRGMAHATWPGVAWQARAGVQLFPWFAIDGSYAGQFNPGYTPRSGVNVGVVNNTLSANLRFIAPLGKVLPYAFVGLGPSFTNVVRWNGAQNTTLQNNTSLAIPFGLGVSGQLSRHWLVSAEGSYQPSVGGSYSTDPTLSTGDIWSAMLGVGYQM